ncbi:MAG: hypothetical protein D4R66_04965 [Opitutales bacterium]|nr:MAG: hypothetical protein D4R66_04965 [Opitutales bacterium]
MYRFLLAASCLTLLPAAQAANWLPSSPLVQIGDDTDIFFDSSFALEITDNLYSAASAKAATNWTVTPGLALEYGKDTPISLSLTAKRSYVYFNKAEFRGLEDSRDALSGNLRFASGGPLTVTLDSSYRVSARNDNLALDGVSPNVFSGTLVRQANYSHAIDIDYKLTEKIKLSTGFTNSYNHYLNPTITHVAAVPPVVAYDTYNTNTLSELNTKVMPLSFDYQAFEKLSFGFNFEHTVTDYSAAPYLNTITPVRPALTSQQFKKDFYGLTAKGQPTESGKINLTAKIGYANSRTDNGPTTGDLAYSINASHVLTERISHNLTLSRDISPSATGGTSASKSYTYVVTFAAMSDMNLNLSVTKSDVVAGSTNVGTMVYTLGTDYKYNNHLSFQASYSFTDSKIKPVTSASFQQNALTASASFRY